MQNSATGRIENENFKQIVQGFTANEVSNSKVQPGKVMCLESQDYVWQVSGYLLYTERVYLTAYE